MTAFPPCLRSGFCCKKSACAFGTYDRDLGQCIHLEVAATLPNGAELHKCGIHDWISEQPGAEVNPAFGSGCCAPLYNDLRDKIIENLKPDDT